eukprot:309917-Pyramimonas_sp.AAC.1
MKANARDGGFSAVVVPDPETPSEFALELRAAEDPDGEWKQLRGHPSSTVYVDWTGTLLALERSARRRFAPCLSAPGEIWPALMRAASAETRGDDSRRRAARDEDEGRPLPH